MLNKALILGGILLSSILIIENTVISSQAYLFIWYSNTSFLTIISILIGTWLWYWIRWFFNQKESEKYEDDDYNY